MRAEIADLIFLDITKGQGGAALCALRRHPLTRHIPVIMDCGNEQNIELFFCSRIGADDFMRQPFPRFEVFPRIEGLLDVEVVPRPVAEPREGVSKIY